MNNLKGPTRCLACATEKSVDKLEKYTYEADRLTDEPICPLLSIECSATDINEQGLRDFRLAIVCHRCFYLLDPDMWISEECWNGLNPVTPYAELPFPVDQDDDSKWDVSIYFSNTL